MPVLHTQESGHALEMAKWELHPTAEVTEEMLRTVTAEGKHMGLGFHGYGNRPYQEYPKMMYLAVRTKPNGVPAIQYPGTGVTSKVEEQNLMSRGFRTDQNEALKVLHDADQAAAEAAAERAYTDRRMTAKAQAEAFEVDRSVGRHLGEIPAAPTKRRQHRKKKVEPPSGQ